MLKVGTIEKNPNEREVDPEKFDLEHHLKKVLPAIAEEKRKAEPIVKAKQKPTKRIMPVRKVNTLLHHFNKKA
jgi:hypothetical protein